MRIFRAAIEEDYAKRLAKLAKMTLGRDEIGYVFHLCIPVASFIPSRVHELDGHALLSMYKHRMQSS